MRLPGPRSVVLSKMQGLALMLHVHICKQAQRAGAQLQQPQARRMSTLSRMSAPPRSARGKPRKALRTLKSQASVLTQYPVWQMPAEIPVVVLSSVLVYHGHQAHDDSPSCAKVVAEQDLGCTSHGKMMLLHML